MKIFIIIILIFLIFLLLINETHIEKYQPINSIGDYPSIDDKNEKKEKYNIKINSEWKGRNVFMSDFVNIFNGIYNVNINKNFDDIKLIGTFNTKLFLKDFSNNYMKYRYYLKSDDFKYAGMNKYEIISKSVNYNLNMNINLNKQNNYLNTTGIVKVDVLEELPVTVPMPNNSLIQQFTGTIGEIIDWKTNYNTTKYIVKQYIFNVKTYGANVLSGNDDNGNSIFIEMNKDEKLKTKIIINDTIYNYLFASI